MPIKILMPALSPTMTEGKLAKWHVKRRRRRKVRRRHREIETDKATMEVEAVDEGTLGKILVPEGTQGVKVNDVIALLLEEGEDAGALDAGTKPQAAQAERKPNGGGGAPQPQPSKPAAQPAAQPAPAPSRQATAAAASPVTRSDNEDRIFASPLARRMAAQAGMELTQVQGSGPHGRIVKTDIEAALKSGPSARSQPAGPQARAPEGRAPQPQAPVPGLPAFTEIPHSGMRRIIAQRLTEAKREQPHFYLTIDCELDALLKLRADLNARSPEGAGAYKLSVNDLLIKAVAVALKRVPAANASWTDTAIRLYQSADISVAVAVPNGLVTPVIRNADAKGLAQISHEMKDVGGKSARRQAEARGISGRHISPF